MYIYIYQTGELDMLKDYTKYLNMILDVLLGHANSNL